MKHIRSITVAPETAQTNFAALVDFLVAFVDQIVGLVTDNFDTGVQIIFNKTGGAIR